MKVVVIVSLSLCARRNKLLHEAVIPARKLMLMTELMADQESEAVVIPRKRMCKLPKVVSLSSLIFGVP